MENVHSINEKQPGRQANGWQPATPQQAVALLSSCLALVRPVGMPESEADDWLGVALGEVAAYPADVLAIGAQEARRTATHHSQIIPTICKECDAIMSQRQRLARLPHFEFKNAPRLAPPRIQQGDVDRLSPMLIKIGLGCGALFTDADGIVRPTPADAA